MEKCAFIDIFTTQNDLFGYNNCPIQFCCEVFQIDEFFDNEKLFNPNRKKLFNIIPDESILIPGYLNSGIKDDIVMSSDFNGLQLKDAMEKIYVLFSKLETMGVYIAGYNHEAYDIDILNRHFTRILGCEPIVFEKNKILDVMKLAERRIPINKIGSYSTDSVLAYILNDCDKVRALRTTRSTANDIKMTKIILRHFMKEHSSFEDLVSELNSEVEIETMSFGKYKGMKTSELIKMDPQYCTWLMRNKDMQKNNTNLVKTIKKLIDTTTV